MVHKSAQSAPRKTRSSGKRAENHPDSNMPSTIQHLPRTSADTDESPVPSTSAASSSRVITRRKLAASTSHPQNLQPHVNAPSPDDQQDLVASQPFKSSSDLSIPPPSLQLSPDLGATRVTVEARQRPKTATRPQAFAKPHKSPLLLRQEKDDKERKKVDKHAAKEVAEAQIQTVETSAKADNQAGKTAPTTKAAVKGTTKRERQKMERMQELSDLSERKRVAPPPWTLQLPNFPSRQNITSRNLPIKVVSDDNTMPTTEVARTAYVAQLLDAMRDVREAQDAVSRTVDFWYVWLKPSLEGKYSYNELDMEWVCRKLVSIAEGLHNYGVGATEIFCPRTIQKAQAAKEMSFKDRIDKLAVLMRKSKARCNLFMLNNTLEDTLALIDQKITDQGSNGSNNKTRSIKLLHSNQVLGMQKGEKWPKDEQGMLAVPEVTRPEPGNDTPETPDVDNGDDESFAADYAHHTGSLQAQRQLLPWLTGAGHHYPTNQQRPMPSYLDPMELSVNAFEQSPYHAARPLGFPVLEHPPEDYDAAVADYDFSTTYASHHSNPVPAGDDNSYMEEFLNFDADEADVEDTRRKRPRIEQPEELSMNSLLRGRTARPPASGSNIFRR